MSNIETIRDEWVWVQGLSGEGKQFRMALKRDLVAAIFEQHGRCTLVVSNNRQSVAGTFDDLLALLNVPWKRYALVCSVEGERVAVRADAIDSIVYCAFNPGAPDDTTVSWLVGGFRGAINTTDDGAEVLERIELALAEDFR